MQKLYKFLFGILCIGLAIVLPFILCNSKSSEQDPPASASISSTSSMFKEITSDGIASYLEITIPDISTNISDIKITQTIGSVSYSPTSDELGTRCYYTNATGVTKNLVYKFTRPATYTVQYKLSNGNIITDSCAFNPEINRGALLNLFTTQDSGNTKNKVVSVEENYFLLSAGEIEIPYNEDLYTLSATTKSVANNALLTQIPDDAFGEITYTLTSNNGHTKIDQKIIVVTSDFNIEFSDSLDTPLLKQNYEFVGADSIGYTFNESVKFSISVDETTTDLSGNLLNPVEKFSLLNIFDFTLNEDIRNSTNTGTLKSNKTILPSPTTSPIITSEIPTTDHSVYTIITSIKNGENNLSTIYSNNLPKIKVITKVPQNNSGDYVFSAILGQVDNTKTNNYISGVLDGYIPLGTTIYYPTTAVRLFYNGYTNKSDKLKFEATTSGSINKGSSKDFTQNGSSIKVSNETTSFDEYFSFSFNIKTYSGTGFIDLLRNRMTYNNNAYITDDFSDVENNLLTPITSFKYSVPVNYETNCIPLHMRVTYNNTSFDKVYNFRSGDEIEFTNYGDYTIEFYNLPSYEFLTANLSTLSDTLYYYKLTFTIEGPSIQATTTDNLGKTITVSNYLYTQSRVDLSVDLKPGQQFIAYKNGNEYARKSESFDFYLNDYGTWKISIIDAAGNELKNLTFTIVDKLYQGFSINKHDEYAKFDVFTRTSKMPETYEKQDAKNAYHLTQAGTYKIEIDAKEELLFKVNSTNQSAYTINSNAIVIEIAKSYFSLLFAEGGNGSRVSKSITITGLSGVQLQSLEVYRDGKLQKTFTADQLAEFETIMENERSFGDNGTYTFRLTDKFGNSYEAQIEKYYKVNVALILLIALLIIGAVIMIVVIIKSRHRISVK